MAIVIFDGDYTQAQLAGPPQFLIPFATDPKPYGYKLKYWQLLNSFSEPELGDPGPLGGGYVGGSPGTFKSVGGGVIEFEREYSRVPDTRSEYESFVAEFFYAFGTAFGPNICLTPTPICTNTRIQFDYFATSDPNSIDLPRKPHVIDTCIGQGVTTGFLDLMTLPTGAEFQCEDAMLKIWKPGIYERKMRFAKWLSGADLFTG